jgi:hypothetical protein
VAQMVAGAVRELRWPMDVRQDERPCAVLTANGRLENAMSVMNQSDIRRHCEATNLDTYNKLVDLTGWPDANANTLKFWHDDATQQWHLTINDAKTYSAGTFASVIHRAHRERS